MITHDNITIDYTQDVDMLKHLKDIDHMNDLAGFGSSSSFLKPTFYIYSYNYKKSNLFHIAGDSFISIQNQMGLFCLSKQQLVCVGSLYCYCTFEMQVAFNQVYHVLIVITNQGRRCTV